MKKFGFTLAEVLITLGIIGVVSALTLPTLLNDTQGAQVGPRLGKAVAMFEQANMTMLNDLSVDRLSDTGLTNNTNDYVNSLSNYLRITRISNSNKYNLARNDDTVFQDITEIGTFNSGDQWMVKDGTVYSINIRSIINRGALVYIDINGRTGPNLIGTDVFAFYLLNDGSLDPFGGAESANRHGNVGDWQTYCATNSTPRDYYACAASIFENNMKVVYQMR